MFRLIYQYVSPFYDFARRKLGIRPKVVNEYLAEHGTASLKGRIVELRYHSTADNSDHVRVGRAGIGHQSHAAKWVNQFNQRAAA